MATIQILNNSNQILRGLFNHIFHTKFQSSIAFIICEETFELPNTKKLLKSWMCLQRAECVEDGLELVFCACRQQTLTVGLVQVMNSEAQERHSQTHTETLFICPSAAELPLSLIFLLPFSSSSSSAVKLVYLPSLSVITCSFPPPVLFVPVVQDGSFL